MAIYLSNDLYEKAVDDLIMTEVAYSEQPSLRVISAYISRYITKKLETLHCPITIICQDPTNIPENQRTLDQLSQDPKYSLYIYPRSGISAPSVLHSKMFLTYAQAIVGSANFTKSGIDKDNPMNVESGTYYRYPEDLDQFKKIENDYEDILACSQPYASI